MVDLLEHDGSPARDPWIISWTLAGKERALLPSAADTEALALNRLRLRGVPYVAGAMLRLRVGVEEVDDHRVVLAAVRLAEPTRLVVRLPHPDGYEPPDEPFQMPGDSVIGVGGRADEVVVSPPRGTLDLQVLRRDGNPAAHATVSLRYLEEGHRSRGGNWELDAEGRRLVQRLYEGTWRVRIHEPGLVQTAQVCEITATETTRVRLREGNGGTVRLRVVDPAGRPLPFAKFRLRDWMWRDLYDGVQRVDPYVGPLGTRTLHHVSPDMDLDVLAWYAGGRGTTEVRVDEGETIDVTVEVTPAE